MIEHKWVLKVTSATAAEIKARRDDLGLSALKLGEKAGLSHQTIGYIETGERKPTLESLIRICAVFEVPLSEFFTCVEKRLKASS